MKIYKYSRAALPIGPKWFEKVEKSDWLGMFMVFRVRKQGWKLHVSRDLCGLNSYRHQRREHLGFLVSFARCEREEEERGVRIKYCWQSNAKDWSQNLYYQDKGIPSF